ncbi:hypothetical protein QGN32_03980 [Mycolicibacterium sp. ND9-15]|uniref:hypothetical protein n=1 Tax=Mycolicibacterium sp. ND9-15 TaxID=3042320 RepID=UPI002DDA437B|nr:hypothetical protein [Mycolicibacterium sp. ND9-15]WSE57075.1 hypothetical protein QGN32_03980 [Mycolicibacterium sp. ND9-15]
MPHSGSVDPTPGATTNCRITAGGLSTGWSGTGADRGGGGGSLGGGTGAGAGAADAGAGGCRCCSGPPVFVAGLRPLPTVTCGGSNACTGALEESDPPAEPAASAVLGAGTLPRGASPALDSVPAADRLADVFGAVERVPESGWVVAADRLLDDSCGPSSSRPEPTRDLGALRFDLTVPPPRLLLGSRFPLS